MYVQWQSRKFNKNTRWRRRGDVHWRAILIENVRVDGKPAQRHIAYLGGITERNIAHEKPAHRIYFWNGVEQKLAVLNFSAKERNAIVQVIAEKSAARDQQAIPTTCPGISKANGKHRGQAV